MTKIRGHNCDVLITDDIVEEKWYFTFGSGHRTALGESLANCYCVIEGTFGEARAKLVETRGAYWAFQYESAEKAGVERFNLHLMPLDVLSLPHFTIRKSSFND